MSLSAREKSIVNDLFSHANESNDLLITNSMLKEQIFQYQNYIKIIKEFFPFFINNDNKESIKEKIIERLKNDILKYKDINFDLKTQTAKLNSTYNKKINEKNEYLLPLNKILDKEKEDNFILKNSIKSKDTFLTIVRKDLQKFRKLYCSGEDEDIRERFLIYNKKVYHEHKKELEKLQGLLNSYSKELNKEKIKNENYDIQLKNLRKILQSNSISKRLFTERYRFYNNDDDDFNIDDEIDDSLIFEDFEKEIDFSDSINFSEEESYINYDLDINLNIKNPNLSQIKNNVILNRLQFPLIKERLFTSDHREVVPKLNLKQIEFNKIRVITEGNSDSNEDDMKNTIQYKIMKMKKKIKKQIEKQNKYKEIISNFKQHYIKMNLKIKKLSLSLNKGDT